MLGQWKKSRVAHHCPIKTLKMTRSIATPIVAFIAIMASRSPAAAFQTRAIIQSGRGASAVGLVPNQSAELERAQEEFIRSCHVGEEEDDTGENERRRRHREETIAAAQEAAADSDNEDAAHHGFAIVDALTGPIELSKRLAMP
mmetsp:Transcript_12154/g.25758  ORF Transcript_12154/g.25758 Transcript_12154/m.25758 type:complete len:144 (-) Transcript_12154:228-659(-)